MRVQSNSAFVPSVLLVANSSFAVASEFENFSSFLISKMGVNVTAIAHPLLRNQTNLVTHKQVYVRGELVTDKKISRLLKPPFSFLTDRYRLPESELFDVGIGFNALQTLNTRRNLLSHGALIHWSIDFVPLDYHPWWMQQAYREVERKMMKSVDLLIENNDRALAERVKRAGCEPKASMIVPITVADDWLNQSVVKSRGSKSVIYVGSIDERNGLPFLLEVAIEVMRRSAEICFVFIGDGPLLPELCARLIESGFGSRATVHGHISSEIEKLNHLRASSLAVAPYRRDNQSFTRYADPQKLKWYSAAALPIITSPEPPSAESLGKLGAARVIPAETRADVDVWATTITDLLGDKERLDMMSVSSLEWARLSARRDQYQRVWNAMTQLMSR